MPSVGGFQPGDTKLNREEPMGIGHIQRGRSWCPEGRGRLGKWGYREGVQARECQWGHAARLGTRPQTGTVRKKGGTDVRLLHRNPHVV